MNRHGQRPDKAFSMTFNDVSVGKFVHHRWSSGSIVRRRLKPALVVRLGDAEIIGIARKVTDRERYNMRFFEGEKILEVHVPKVGRRTSELIARFGESIEGLKKLGFAGFVGHTPSRPIGERFKFAYGMEELATNAKVEAEVKAHIQMHIKQSGYPEKLLTEPIMTIVKRFD